MIPTQPSPRQEARKAETRGKILAASRVLFGQFGYNATTIDQITHHAGVGRGTFYVHFSGKPELFQRLYVDFRTGLLEVLSGLGETPVIDDEHVGLWIRRYIAYLVSQAPSMIAILTAAHTGVDSFIKREQWHAMALDAFGRRIAAFRIAAERQDTVVTARAQLILFQLEGFASACALDNWNADIDVTISELAKAILAFIEQTERLEGAGA